MAQQSLRWPHRPLVDAPGPAQVAMTEPYLDFFTRAPLVAFYFPIYDYSSQPPALVAAEATARGGHSPGHSRCGPNPPTC